MPGACLLPASAPSPVSLQLPKRQLLIPAFGASCSAAHAQLFFFFLSVLLFLFCSEHTEPTEKSEQRLQGLKPGTIPPSRHGPGWVGDARGCECSGCCFYRVASLALPDRDLCQLLCFPGTVSIHPRNRDTDEADLSQRSSHGGEATVLSDQAGVHSMFPLLLSSTWGVSPSGLSG